MNTKEIYRELDMTYDELVDYLLKKYGAAQYNYFTNEACTSKSKRISRTVEGLFCHHIDEDKGFKLSDKSSAIKYPFDYQRANRLLYCNYLEHLMLHIRINPKSRLRASGFWTFYLSGETRLHFLPGGKKIEVLPPLSPSASDCPPDSRISSFESLHQKIKAERANALSAFMVRTAGFEPTVS